VARSITWGLGLIQRHLRDRGASTTGQSSGDHKSAAASASIERLLFLPRVQDRVKDAIDDDTRAGDKGDSKYDSDGSSSSGSGGEEEGSSAALAFLLQPIQQEKLCVSDGACALQLCAVAVYGVVQARCASCARCTLSFLALRAFMLFLSCAGMSGCCSCCFLRCLLRRLCLSRWYLGMGRAYFPKLPTS